MGRKLLKIIIIILMMIGIVSGVKLTISRLLPNLGLKSAEANIINKTQSVNAELESFYTYGRSLNVKGKIPRISKENIESIKLYISDGMEYERYYNINYSVEDGNLYFETSEEMNNGIIIDELETGKQYYVLLRLKLNNSINPRFFSFESSNKLDDIDYYTITKDGKNRLAKIALSKKKSSDKEYSFLSIKIEEASLPEDVYDIVVDAGHGGKDPGEKSGNYTEADIDLDVAYALKEKLEEAGYKVKLTRDNENTENYTSTNMYNDNGRITVACESKAKLMISLHMNNGESALRGFEIYCPPKSSFELANSIASKIKEKSEIEYSNGNSFKKSDGVYLRNFRQKEINEMAKKAENSGYDAYTITENTPYLYTIREVGGIATGAYVDGRNKSYSANQYYMSRQGLECYQIELGYIKTDAENVLNNKEKIAEGIAEAIKEFYN